MSGSNPLEYQGSSYLADNPLGTFRRQAVKSPQAKAHAEYQAGGDEVLGQMIAGNMPLTRDMYLSLAYGDHMPDPWTADHEAQLPEMFQDPSKLQQQES